MKFFKRELIGKHGVTGWRVGRWHKAMERYNEHFEAIRSRLPVEVVQFHQLSLHDLVVKECERVAQRQLRLRIDWLQVFFLDVRSCELPADLVGAAWLYSEICLSNPVEAVSTLDPEGLLPVQGRATADLMVRGSRWT
jgi:hypothetical protein